MTQDIANKRLFTATNVVVICTAVVQCVVLWFMLNSKIDATNSDIRLLELRVRNLEDQNKIYDLSLSTLAKIQGNMIKQEEPVIKKNR